MEKEQTLQDLLEERGVKQRDLCSLLNLSGSQVSLLVTGKRRMSLEIGVKIAKKLRVSPNTIFLSLNFAKRKGD